jgi:hypothetical protein
MTEPAYTKKEAYVLRLHELLWQFIERADPTLTGDVVECAEQALAEPDEDYDESMDGDHASALASAGWGTDEDYGGGGEQL